MGNYAGLVFGIVGGVIGAYFGNPYLGYAIGSALGNALFPIQLPEVTQFGPQLGDLKVQSSTYGKPVPRLYGTIRVAGNVIWSRAIDQTTNVNEQDVGGKAGGPEQSVTTTTYTYSLKCAVAICQGPITGVRRIWANNQLIYDIGDSASFETYISSQALFGAITVYLGDETQLADPLIESFDGIAPAYRGTAYVVLQDLQLGNFGNRIPNLEFEVVKAGTMAPVFSALDTVGQFEYGVNGSITPDGLLLVANKFLSGGAKLQLMNPFTIAPLRDFNAKAFTAGNRDVGSFTAPRMNGRGDILFTDNINELYFWPAGGTPALLSTTCVCRNSVDEAGNFYVMEVTGAARNLIRVSAETGAVTVLFTFADGSVFDLFDSRDGFIWISREITIAGGAQITKHSRANGQLISTTVIAAGAQSIAIAGDGSIWYVGRDGASLYRYPSTTAIVTTTTFSGSTSIRINRDWSNGDILFGGGGGDYKRFAEDGTLVRSMAYPSGVRGLQVETDARFPNMIYVFDVTGNNTPATHRVLVERKLSLDAGTMTLDDIVTSECGLVGLEPADIDVTALAADTVRGFVLAGRGPLRAALEPLMAAFMANAIESAGQLVFIKRGANTVATIAEDDMGARLDSAEPAETITATRTQEPELPRELAINYIDVDADYQVGTQYARRLVVRSDNARSFNLPLVLNADEALRLANVLLYEAWAQRNAYALSVSMQYAKLEPTDAVSLALSDGTVLSAVIARTQEGQGVRKIDALGYEPSIYTQDMPGVAPSDQSTVTVGLGPTNLVLLDTALLNDQQDTYGLYAGASGYLEGWRGAKLFKSSDAALAYADTGIAFSAPSVTGFSQTALADFAGGNVFDLISTVDVSALDGTLASTTQAAVLDGANAAYLGGEIIQFTTATLTAVGVYRLSGLLRGRLGTEWAMARHVVGEPFAMLSVALLRDIPAPATDQGQTRYYKGVTFGTSVDAAAARPLTLASNRLRPLSPVQIGGGRDTAGGITLNWIRRARMRADWLDSVDVALDEPVESYEVDLFAGAGKTITGITQALDGNFASTAHGFIVGDLLHITGVVGMLPVNDRPFTVTSVPDANHFKAGENTAGYAAYVSGGVARKRGRLVTASTPTASYNQGDQTTDYGSPQATVYAVVYQLSSRIGRGYPGVGTI